ncbi:MAG: Gfo/Idh/MocA family oxidoreductase [Pirellulales bacterium]|nr:Gfo/Idh/MocA family oxidoreductase [Pirellulales bacterium]
MSRQSRRDFLKTAAAAGIGASFFIGGTKASGRVVGANDRIRVAVAGINGRGLAHIGINKKPGGFASLKNVEVAALADPDSRLFDDRSKRVQDWFGYTPKCYQDVRRVLDDPTIDAITIATPNHWHSLMTIWACQAGKHVYVEKPCSHNVFEGRKAVEAARKYNRLVQHGSQQRSSQVRADQMAALHAGKYGKLLVARGYCCKPRWSIGFKPTAAPPKELDFDLWLGPAAKQPYHENLVHYNWHWFWDTGNGDMGNQGIHEIDAARWGIKDATLPQRIWSLGGRWVDGPDYRDQGETPNMLLSVFEFGDVLMVFETRGLVQRKGTDSKKVFPAKVGNDFYTTEGRIDTKADRFYPRGGGRPVKVNFEGPRVMPGGMFGSFINTLRDGDFSKCNVDILEGHLSSAVCHLGNISYRLGKQVAYGQKPEHMGTNPQVHESFDTIRHNLAGAGFELDDKTYQVGPVLEFDPKAERFVDNEAANAMLTRPARPPFAVPDDV